MGKMKVADVSYSDVENLHRKITKEGKTTRANRVASLLSKLFALAIKWRMRIDNPICGIERNAENKRRALSVRSRARGAHQGVKRSPQIPARR